MRGLRTIALCAMLSTGSAGLAEGANCPALEAGALYPWQSSKVIRGDQFAWVILDVDRTGYPYRCRVGNNNYNENEKRFWLCKNYTDRWRGPPAAASEPDRRTLQRFSLVTGYDHFMADRKARVAWFKANPDKRPECFPEPTRPDRLP